MFRPLGKRDALAAMIIFALVCVLTYLSSRTRATYRNSTELAMLRQEIQTLRQARETDLVVLRGELDDIERTLYAQPTTPTQMTRRPSSLEQWQINQYREMSQRITALERWRLRWSQ